VAVSASRKLETEKVKALRAMEQGSIAPRRPLTRRACEQLVAQGYVERRYQMTDRGRTAVKLLAMMLAGCAAPKYDIKQIDPNFHVYEIEQEKLAAVILDNRKGIEMAYPGDPEAPGGWMWEDKHRTPAINSADAYTRQLLVNFFLDSGYTAEEAEIMAGREMTR
jgi:hypothetical protein